MHQETLTTLHLSQEKTQEYLAAQIDQAVERHGGVLESLMRRVILTEDLPASPEAAANGIVVDLGQSREDDTGLQIMQETLDVARSFADVVSNRGSVQDQSNSGCSMISGGLRRGFNAQAEDRHKSEDVTLAPQDSISNIGLSVVAGGDVGTTHDTLRADLRNATIRGQNEFGSQANIESFPPELMTNLLENYIMTAERDLQTSNYREAVRNLDLADKEGLRRESIHKYPFDEEKLKIEILRAAAYIELEELDTAETVLETTMPLTAEDSLKRGEAYYLLAKVHRARYLRAKDPAQLDQLEEAAERSYSYALNSEVVRKPYLIESAQIIFNLYEWKGNSVGADIFRDRHPSMSIIVDPTTPAASLSTENLASEPSMTPSTRFTRTRLYSSGSQALSSPPSLATVETQSTVSSFECTSSAGSEPTTALTSSLQPVASVNLLTSIKESHVPMVKYLLEQGDDVERIDEETGLTPLLTAAKLKHTEICELLLTNNPQKANVHATSKDGRTVLHIALSRPGGEDMIPLLLQHRADPNRADSDGKTPLHYCAEYNQKKAALHLLSVKADLDKLSITRKETPLHLAMRKKKRDVVAVLLKGGAEVNTAKLPPTSPDIEYLVKERLGQLASPRRRSTAGVTRQDSTSTVVSGSASQTEGSVFGRVRNRLRT